MRVLGEIAEILGMAGIAQVHHALVGEGGAVPGQPRGQNAVKHVDPTGDQLDHLRRRAQAHRVAGLIRRKQRRHPFRDAHHVLLRLADAQPADGVAVKTHRHEFAGRFFAQILIHTALHDAEVLLRPAAGLRAVFINPLRQRFAHRRVKSRLFSASFASQG
jgi:hypothetical protein